MLRAETRFIFYWAHNENAYGSSNDIDIVNTNSANIYDFSGIINVNMSPTGNSPVSVSDSTGVTINTVSGTDVTIANQAGAISVNNTGSVVTGQRFVGLNVQNYNGGIAYFSGSSINQFSSNLTATNVESLDFRERKVDLRTPCIPRNLICLVVI